jgi:hypothetical protein
MCILSNMHCLEQMGENPIKINSICCSGGLLLLVLVALLLTCSIRLSGGSEFQECFMLGCLAAIAAFGFFLASPRPSSCSHIELVRNINVALRAK